MSDQDWIDVYTDLKGHDFKKPWCWPNAEYPVRVEVAKVKDVLVVEYPFNKETAVYGYGSLKRVAKEINDWIGLHYDARVDLMKFLNGVRDVKTSE